MFDNSLIDKEIYSKLMNQIKDLNNENKTIRKSKEYKVGFTLTKFIEYFVHGEFALLKRHCILVYNNIKFRKNKKNNNIKKTLVNRNNNSNYFSNEKIAVYTCIFGKYDMPLEPLFKPDNCDYYIITDQEVPENSLWKKIDYSYLNDELKELTNAEKNRYFKMLPHVIFKDYKYSIYVDGNIKIYTDLTEYIHKIKECGFATHLHSKRNCIYEEGKAVVKLGKEKQENVEKYFNELRKNNMPENYGLLECNVLVREHNNIRCKEIMLDWWKEFKNKIKRDQLSLPYILYKRGISIEEIGTLGNDVFLNNSFRIIRHEDSKL